MTDENKFYLYHTLNKSTNSVDLNKNEKEELIQRLSNLDEDSMEACIKLILEHRKTEVQEENNLDVPYSGIKKINENGKYDLEFDLSNLPIKLRKILYNFIQIIDKNKK